MDRLVYTTLSAATSQEFNRIQLTSDLANVSTTGYKRGNSHAPVSGVVEGPGFRTRFQPLVSSGVEAVDLAPGPALTSGNPLDLFMHDNTVLGVQAADGNIAFTRRGDLRINPAGLLETSAGNLVMSAAGGPISVPADFQVTMTEDGGVYVTDPAVEAPVPQLVGQLMLRDASATGLVRRTDGLYQPALQQLPNGDFASGTEPARVTSGALEGSNVNPVEVMVNLLDLQRSFETQMKIIKSMEELDRDGAQMMSLR
jgi:flagellar basal-body rod protein FlgF